MNQNQWKHVGKVKEPHGLKGELYILLFSGEAAWASKLKEFRLNSTIFQVERQKKYKEGLLIKPLGIDDRNQSEALKGHEFWIPAELLVSQKGETIYLSEILNFEVFDGSLRLGPIVAFSSNGPQDLLVVDYQGNDVEIPFVQAFVERIDFEGRQVLMNLPEGLYGQDPEI